MLVLVLVMDPVLLRRGQNLHSFMSLQNLCPLSFCVVSQYFVLPEAWGSMRSVQLTVARVVASGEQARGSLEWTFDMVVFWGLVPGRHWGWWCQVFVPWRKGQFRRCETSLRLLSYTAGP